MSAVDVNCLVGHWPFRKIRKNTFEDLRKVHEENGIACGFAASLNSIFYNDPFEGDEELHEAIKGTGYRHILTINPRLPGFTDDIRKGVERFDIGGIRIYPSYHGYALDDGGLRSLCEVLREENLPLFLSVRMGDERLSYLMNPPAPDVPEIREFLNHNRENTVVLLNIKYHEILALKDILDSSDRVFVDTSGLKDGMFILERLLESVNEKKVLYGSLHPLYCLKSTLLLVEKAEISPETKQRILSGNSEALLTGRSRAGT